MLVPGEVHHDEWATIVYRRFDGAPQLVVITDGTRPEALRGPSVWSERHDAWVDQKSYDRHWRLSSLTRFEVDARRGRVFSSGGAEFEVPPGATVVHVSSDGVTASTTPFGPASPLMRELASASALTRDGGWSTLAACLPEVQDPVLRGVLDGVTSARCYEAGVPDGRLLARVDHGRLVSAVIASGFPAQRHRCLGCLVAEGPPRLVRVGGRGTGSGSLGDAELPSLADVREAPLAVERGAPVESATATWPRAVTRHE